MIDRDGLIVKMAPEYLADLLFGLPKDVEKELLALRQEAGRVSGLGFHETIKWSRERSLGVILAHSLHAISTTMVQELKRMDDEGGRSRFQRMDFSS